ncbi:MAG TPA: hypothetical protein VFQ51_12825, partial [Vicinamibacteria bacterium]|nr:hypothetical protein [Vicinamibacteria bacterium]
MFGELNEELKVQLGKYGVDTRSGRFANPIFELHPAQVLGFMEAVWEMWRRLDEDSLTTPIASSGEKAQTAGSGKPQVLSDTTARARVVALGNVERKGAAKDGAIVLS